jgi:hypothetical protein
MTDDERQRKIEEYGKAPAYLQQGLARFPRSMWKFRPSSGWSIHEIVVHIADSEANSYVRCRRFLAEPGQPLMAYDGDRWARDLHYHDQDPDQAVEQFEILRRRSYDLIRRAPPDAWGRQCYHPENGNMTLDDWLDIYARHIPEHVQQMDEVYAEWRQDAR